MAKNKPIAPEGKFAGVPYDWRKPTLAKAKSRYWNPEAGLITPKVFGWGFDLNFYRLLHPFQSRSKK